MDAFRLELGSREIQEAHVMACVNFLRTTLPYTGAGLVYVVENLPGSRGGELAYQLRNVTGCITMSEYGHDKRPGVPKTPVTTQNMGVRTRNLLNSNSIHIARNMGTFPGATPDESAAAARDVQKKLIDQLLAFEIDDHGRWTGKNGPSGRDDLAVALMMTYYWYETFCQSAAYQGFRATY